MVEQRDAATSLEEALGRTEADAERALRSAAAAVAQIRKAKAAAGVGNVRDLKRAIESAGSLLEEASADAARLAAGWQFDERAHLESGAFARELRLLGESRGLSIVEQDSRLLTYPSVIRVVPSEAAIEVDRKRERRIRPSVLVERLRAAQHKPPRLKAEPFLETLRKAYDVLLGDRAPGSTVRLVDVYDLLTLLPGRDYSKQEFARDIFLLDRAGVTRTRDGSVLRLPAATGTKGGGPLSTVTPEGDLKPYYGIAFDP